MNQSSMVVSLSTHRPRGATSPKEGQGGSLGSATISVTKSCTLYTVLYTVTEAFGTSQHLELMSEQAGRGLCPQGALGEGPPHSTA